MNTVTVIIMAKWLMHLNLSEFCGHRQFWRKMSWNEEITEITLKNPHKTYFRLNKIQINLKPFLLFQWFFSLGLLLNVQVKPIQHKMRINVGKGILWLSALLQSQMCQGSGWWPKYSSTELWSDALCKVTEAAKESDIF